MTLSLRGVFRQNGAPKKGYKFQEFQGKMGSLSHQGDDVLGSGVRDGEPN